MATTSNTIYLVTGANRGIGRVLTDTFLARSNTIVLALVRDPSHETSQSLLSPTTNSSSSTTSTTTYGTNSRAILIRYDASNPSSADKAISQIQDEHNIHHLDIVIANAGFAGFFGPMLDATPEDWLSHYTTNTLGPVMLFRACLPLLLKSQHKPLPVFTAISSAVGSTTMLAAQALAVDTQGKSRRGAIPYGSSKCALNHVMVRLASEYKGKVGVKLLTPGPTKTGFGGDAVKWENVPGAMDVETVVKGLVERIEEDGDGAEGKALQLRDWSGKVFDW